MQLLTFMLIALSSTNIIVSSLLCPVASTVSPPAELGVCADEASMNDFGVIKPLDVGEPCSLFARGSSK